MKVVILLATYNGSKYLAEQMDSLLFQDGNDVEIIIHDDGSIDETRNIIELYRNKHSDRIDIIDQPSTKGASMNFSLLMSYALNKYLHQDDVYFMCADQDDIWHQNKVSESLQRIRDQESIHNSNFPLLVHSDLKLINEEGYVISDSLFKYQNLDEDWGTDFSRLLTQNIITGCTIIMNKALLIISLPIPAGAIMHDWWLGLVACAHGEIIFINKPTISYRQHSSNEVGAKKFDRSYIFQKMLYFFKSSARRNYLKNASMQAKEFAERFPGNKYRKIAEIFGDMNTDSYLIRKKKIIKYGYRKIGWQRQIAWLILG
jgi:glycosyltransferase involved in cell wall biosynthesis